MMELTYCVSEIVGILQYTWIIGNVGIWNRTTGVITLSRG